MAQQPCPNTPIKNRASFLGLQLIFYDVESTVCVSQVKPVPQSETQQEPSYTRVTSYLYGLRTRSVLYINSCLSFLRRRFKFFQALMRHCPHEGRLPSSSNPLLMRTSAGTESKSGSNHKRQSNRQTDKDGDDPEKRGGGSSRIPISSDANGRGLACPFYKKDPRRHSRCAEFRTHKISYVKQHIYRSHRQPPYCTFCGNAFADPESRDRHVAAGCLPRPYNEPDGITLWHREMLSNRSSPHLNIAEQWFAVFDIVCPGQARPLTPYHDSELSGEAFTELREFVTGMLGTEIVFAGLRQSMGWRPQDEALLREALSRGLGNLVDEWVMRRSASPEAIHNENIPDASLRPLPTPTILNEAQPPAHADTRHGTASASPNTFFQLPSTAPQNASYIYGASQNMTFLQTGSTFNPPFDVDFLEFDIECYALPNPESPVLPEDPINDESWPDGSANDAEFDPAAHQ